MAPIFLAVALVAAAVGGAQGCAFVKQGCMPSVCNSLKLADFDDLLNPTSSLLSPSVTFNPNDVSSKGDWNSAALKNTLGYFYGVYNPRFNGGKFSSDKWAVRDNAPSLNYLSFRNSFGELVKNKGKSLSACCNYCRTTPGCILYQFNPYVNTILDDDDNELGRSFWPNGAGDCYVLKSTSATSDTVSRQCANTSSTEFFSTTTKPTFYGGYCNAEVKDDPHFVGARGTRYDFNGQLDKAFCLVTDTRLQINTVLRGYHDLAGGETGLRSWMKELGFVWLDAAAQKHSLHLVARSGAQRERGDGFLASVRLDGASVAVPARAGESVSAGEMTLTFQGTRKMGPYDVDHFRLAIGESVELGLSLRVAHPKLQTPEEAEVHFNVVLNAFNPTPAVHGVLGQTYRHTPDQRLKAIKFSVLSRILGTPVQADGQTGKGFLDGDVEDYITSSVTSTDCKFSSF